MTAPLLKKAEQVAWGCGAIGLGLLGLGAVVARAQLFQSYWVCWLFWSGLSFGSFALVQMQALTGGRWAAVLRHPAEAAVRTLPLCALLMLPVALGFRAIFPWAQPGALDTPAWIHHRAFLQTGWFWVRAALYFAALLGLAWAQRLGSHRTGSRLAGLAAVVYVLAMNFASTDWIMSLEPAWTSTIFAIIFIVTQFLSALALCGLVALLGWPAADPATLRDIGNLLLAFVVFWAYVTFSQFLIIWSGNLPREIVWYVHRRSGAWPLVALALGVGQFLLPFALLLSRAVKQNPRRLAIIAGVILGANLLHYYWLVAPTYHPSGVSVHWLDAAAFLAVGGAWSAMFLHHLATQEVRV